MGQSMDFGAFHSNGSMVVFRRRVSQELKMFRKFLIYQDLLLSDVTTTSPKEVGEFFTFSLVNMGRLVLAKDRLNNPI